MRGFIQLILLVVVSWSASVATGQTAAEEPVSLQDPVRASLRLTSTKAVVKGKITAWTYGAFWVEVAGEGSPTRVAWDDVNANRLVTTMQKVIDRKDAESLLRFGIELLVMDETGAARKVFRMAERADRSVGATAQRAVALHLAGADPMGALAIDRHEDILRGKGEDAKRIQDHQAAIDRAKPHPVIDEIERLAKDGLQITRHETEHFVLYIERGEEEAQVIGQTLEKIHDMYAEILGAPAGEPLCREKLICYLIEGDEAYGAVLQALQADSDDPSLEVQGNFYYARRSTDSAHELLCRFRGEWRVSWELILQENVIRGLVERSHSTTRLPRWAEVGLVLHSFTVLQADDPEMTRWQLPAARAYCKANEASLMFRMNEKNMDLYTNGTRAASMLFVQFLRARDGAAFKEWIRMVKRGHDWEVALEDVYQLNLDQLSWIFEDAIGAK